MVLLILPPVRNGTMQGNKPAVKSKSVKYRRVVSRRVSVVVSESIKIKSPANIHHKSIRFAFKPVSGVYEVPVVSPQQANEVHYTPSAMHRIATERQQEANEIRKVIEAKGSFSENNEMTIEGLEDLVYPDEAKKRLQSIQDHTHRVVALLRSNP